MISTLTRNAVRRPALHLLHRTFTVQGAPVLVDAIGNNNSALRNSAVPPHQFSTTMASAAAGSFDPNVVDSEPISGQRGYVTKTLKALDMAVVRQIKAELLAVDQNNDGRIDAAELKKLLRKHSAFSDEEIIEIGELFYAGKAGGSVTFDRFIEAIDFVTVNNDKTKSTAVDDGNHFKETDRHPLGVGRCGLEYLNTTKISHGHYTEEELDVKITHVMPSTIGDKIAFNAVKAVRFFFDSATGWRNDQITTDKVLNRVIFLETVAAVPGMVAAIVRHFKSLRAMQRDGGMLQMFLEEANNERMHLLTFVQMKDPNRFFRAAVIGGQFGFGTFFLLAYMISPKFCHRFVGYIEEEAVHTYTRIIAAIDSAPEGSEMAQWKHERAPNIAISYWKLGERGTILDMIKAVRADEAEHRDVNHLMSGLDEKQGINPLYDPQAKLDQMLLKYVNDIMTRPVKEQQQQ